MAADLVDMHARVEGISSYPKLSAPRLYRVLERERLYAQLDQCLERAVTWVGAPAGAGKTTLVGAYLKARRHRVLWYQLDGGDGEAATFFYYLGLAAEQALGRRLTERLPVLG